MANTFNFNNLKKKYLTVTLNDEKQTTLLIGTPTKSIMDDLMILQSGKETVAEGETGLAEIDAIYDACARVLSHNKQGITVTAEKLGEICDIEDLIGFFTAYMTFVAEIGNEKN